MREGLDEWKAALRRDFEAWLATVEEVPAEEDTEELDAPDLYSFYEQLAAANAENRKANRRTAEALGQWGETLVRFEGDLAQWRDHLARLQDQSPPAQTLPRPACLGLIELLDRLDRLGAAFGQIPKAHWWGNDSAWRQAWDRQREGLDIVRGHLEAMLKKEGVVHFEAVGQPFDPARMLAVATETTAAHPHHTVLEEVAAGYLHHGELLRTAQVKVSLNPTPK